VRAVDSIVGGSLRNGGDGDRWTGQPRPLPFLSLQADGGNQGSYLAERELPGGVPRQVAPLPPHAAALGRLGLGVDGDGQAVERAIKRRQHAALDEVEGGGLPVARARP